jgi:uncharacterized membrane protein YfcA
MEWIWIAIGAFVFLGFTLEAITGFGGTVIALALGAQLLPIATLVPILVPLSVCLGAVMVWRHRGHIDRHLLLRVVLPGMFAGTIVGYAIKPWLDEALMRQLFGVLIVWFASRELWRMRHAAPAPVRPAWLTTGITGLAGVTHGLFASGGPLLVYALSGLSLNKASFRVTLIMVWLVLDGTLMTAFALDGRLAPALPLVAVYLPVIGLGVWAGEWLHHRVSEERFRVGVYALLLVTGLLLAKP